MESFQYDPIIHEEHAFRIVRLFAGSGPDIQAEIIHASFDQIDILEYEALSYVWGSPELTSSIYVKDQSLRITKNLELVLRDLRLVDQDRLLWVDGLCIDQKNDREKTHQVRQMRDIYQRAESVLFYLGHSKEPQHILHNTMLAIQEQQNLEPGTTFALVWDEVRNKLAQQYTNFETRIRNSVESTLEAPWFRRVWIIQEVANARRASIYSGGASFRVAGFVHLVRYLDIEIEDHQTAILEMMPKKRRSQSPWSHQQDLLSLLRRFRHAEATQNHDKIFALLGMCMDGRGHGTVTVDYEKKEDLVIREVVSYISFCEKDDVEDFCSTIKSVKNLLGRVDSLLQDLLVHLAIRKRLKGLRSLLWYRRDESLITESILKAMIEGRNIEPEAVDVLPAYISDRTMMTIDVVSGPVIKADIDILRIFLTHISDAFIVARVLNSALFSAPWCRDGSNNETIRHLLNSSIKISQDLSLAARDGNADSIWKLLEKGADINMIDPNGVTPLGWAAASGQKDMVEFLLGLSANIETGHQSPLSLAVEHGHKDIVQLLLDRDANIESSDRYGRTPLSLSASGGCRAILSLGRSEIGHERLITIMKRGNTHHLRGRFDRVVESSRVVGLYRNNDARTSNPGPVFHHIPEVYSEIAGLLLQKGADMTTRDCLRATPLWWATNYGHLPVVDILLQRTTGAIHVRDIYDLVPMSWALWNGHQAVVKRFLDERTRIKLDGDNNPLFWAACNGSETQIQWLVDKGLDIKVGATVSWAASSGHASTVKLLLDMNAPTIVDGEEPALLIAASAGHEMIVQALLDHGEDTEIPNAMGSTPLILAAGKGHRGTVQLLLKNTANVNVRDKHGRTPLMYAARGGFPDIVEILIKHDAKVDAKTNDGDGYQTGLWQAAQYGHHQVVRLLLTYEADIEAHDLGGETPLMIACCCGHEKTARILLEQNANVNATTRRDKHTALFYAARNNNQKIVHLLLEHGAEADIRDHQGVTPLMMACRSGHEETARILLKQNVNVDATTQHGMHTALFYAARNRNQKIVSLLLGHGADTDIPDHRGATPLMMACRSGHEETIGILLEHNAKVHTADSEGCTALDRAVDGGYESVEKMLRGSLAVAPN